MYLIKKQESPIDLVWIFLFVILLEYFVWCCSVSSFKGFTIDLHFNNIQFLFGPIKPPGPYFSDCDAEWLERNL